MGQCGFERSTETMAVTSGLGSSVDVPRVYKGIFDVRGGLDTKLVGLFSLRLEVRDFVRSGQAISESRQNLAFLAGPVLHL